MRIGQTPQQDADIRALVPGAAQQQEEALIRQGLARVLTGSISAPIDRVFEQTFGTTVQITPSLGSETDPLTPSARLVIGRRLSNRAYLTFARALGNSKWIRGHAMGRCFRSGAGNLGWVAADWESCSPGYLRRGRAVAAGRIRLVSAARFASAAAR